MTRRSLILAIVFLGSAGVLSQSATAQSTYTPQSPTVSPWLGLWNNNTGALDNYHTFVRPQMELNRALQMQNLALNRQAAGLQALSAEVNQPQGGQSRMLPTGQGGTFMSYSHYYSSNLTPQSAAPRTSATRKASNFLSNTTVPTEPPNSQTSGFQSPGFQGAGYQR